MRTRAHETTLNTEYRPAHARREGRVRRAARAAGRLLRNHVSRERRQPELPLDIFEPNSGSERIERTTNLKPGEHVQLDMYQPIADADTVRSVLGTELGDLMGIIKLPTLVAPKEYGPYYQARVRALTQLYIFRERAGERGRARTLVMGWDQLYQMHRHHATKGRVPMPEEGAEPGMVLALEPGQWAQVGRNSQTSWLPIPIDLVDQGRPEYPQETYDRTSRQHATVHMDEYGGVYVQHLSTRGSTSVEHGAASMAGQDPWAANAWANQPTDFHATV